MKRLDIEGNGVFEIVDGKDTRPGCRKRKKLCIWKNVKWIKDQDVGK